MTARSLVEARVHQLFDRAGAGDIAGLLELLHADVELAPRIHPGEVLRGRDAVETFLAAIEESRAVFEPTVASVHVVDGSRAVVEGRVRWTDKQSMLRDDPSVWALEFEGGLLRRSRFTRSAVAADGLLAAPYRQELPRARARRRHRRTARPVP